VKAIQPVGKRSRIEKSARDGSVLVDPEDDIDNDYLTRSQFGESNRNSYIIIIDINIPRIIIKVNISNVKPILKIIKHLDVRHRNRLYICYRNRESNHLTHRDRSRGYI